MLRMILILSALLFSQFSFAGTYFVKHKPNVLTSFAKIEGLQLESYYSKGSFYIVNIDEDKEIDVLATLNKDESVEYVVKDFKLYAFKSPIKATTALKSQWHLEKIGANKAWKLAGKKGSKKVTVAVIDTGIDYTHQDLKPNMVAGYDFRDNDDDPMDDTSSKNPGHGTHCAGIIGASGLVDGGVSGMSPQVTLMPIRFLGSDGSGTLEGGIKSIDYAIEKGVDIISASWGAAVSASQAKPLIEAVKRASDAGVIFVAAAANDGKNNDKRGVYPSNAVFENTISVAASGNSDEKPSWSNYGKKTVHIASPGLKIMSTLPGNKYGKLSGTSMATPLVAGLVAFLKSNQPNLTGKQIRAILQSTGSKVDIETACNCRIDAFEATTSLLQGKKLVAPHTLSIMPNQIANFELMNANGEVKFETTDANIATVDASGVLTAKTAGTVKVLAMDASGEKISSSDINVYQSSGGGDDGGGGGGGGECPLGSQELCDIACQVMPDLPWCN